MIPESCNYIFGEAKNPWNFNLTTGGSSGGCAGMVSTLCSPISIGTDVGGSVRGPAAICGVCSFKPTAGYLPLSGRHTHDGLD